MSPFSYCLALRTQIPKQLSENKLKRLNILSFINGKKDILFTKKASKYEKERVWRQIFQKMLDFGMVTPQRDWRYVRDVSFSNWRKRAQVSVAIFQGYSFRRSYRTFSNQTRNASNTWRPPASV